MNSTLSSVCWVCGKLATTGEHMIKCSDLRSEFGEISQSKPIFRHDANAFNRPIKGLRVDVLKSPGLLCYECNNSRTQPHDRAWDKLSFFLRRQIKVLQPGQLIRLRRVFPNNTNQEMLNVHLYFVALFGCHVVGNSIPLDTSKFSDAIINNKPHQNIFLQFGCGATFSGLPRTGMSDMLHVSTLHDKQTRIAKWFHYVGGVGIKVMFAEKGEKWEELLGAWHPMHCTTRIKIFDFGDKAPRL